MLAGGDDLVVLDRPLDASDVERDGVGDVALGGDAADVGVGGQDAVECGLRDRLAAGLVRCVARADEIGGSSLLQLDAGSSGLAE